MTVVQTLLWRKPMGILLPLKIAVGERLVLHGDQFYERQVAPVTGCHACHLNEQKRVPYAADYSFYAR